VRTGVRIEGADASEVATADGSIAYDALVWTGGIAGSSALMSIDYELASQNRSGSCLRPVKRPREDAGCDAIASQISFKFLCGNCHTTC
jgi:hypothetical protein